MAQEEDAGLKAAESQQGQAPVESQPPQGPAPEGEPEPVGEGEGGDYGTPFRDTAVAVIGGLVVAGLVLVVVGSVLTPTHGATRSAKLQVEERRQLIQQAALEDAQTTQAPSASE